MVLALQILAAIASFDVMYFAGLITGNFFFLFAFIAVASILGNCTQLVRKFIFLVMALFCIVAITQVAGVDFFPGKNTVLFFGFIVMPIFVLGADTRIEKHTRKILVFLMIALSLVF
jgi:hypothetical protein